MPGLAHFFESVTKDIDAEPQKILPEAAIARLREAAGWMAAPNPFKPGDIVTPRKGMTFIGVGNPHLVLDVESCGFAKGVYESGQNGAADIHNIKVAAISPRGSIVTHTMPHWALEAWTA